METCVGSIFQIEMTLFYRGKWIAPTGKVNAPIWPALTDSVMLLCDSVTLALQLDAAIVNWPVMLPVFSMLAARLPLMLPGIHALGPKLVTAMAE